MQEKPILFNGPMVVAILNGTKTQTRRPVRPQPKKIPAGWYWDDGKYNFPFNENTKLMKHVNCPHGSTGDRLWVRETFTVETNFNLDDCDPPFKDGRPVQWHEDCGWGRWWEQAHYQATDPAPYLVHEDDCKPCDENGYCNKWRPSLHMPRWASRILLEITNVRVERIQDINGTDILAEGTDNGQSNPTMGVRWHNQQRLAFHPRWDAIYPGSWERNDWVWVIEFKRITP